eukprot:gene17566-19318_t
MPKRNDSNDFVSRGENFPARYEHKICGCLRQLSDNGRSCCWKPECTGQLNRRHEGHSIDQLAV